MYLHVRESALISDVTCLGSKMGGACCSLTYSGLNSHFLADDLRQVPGSCRLDGEQDREGSFSEGAYSQSWVTLRSTIAEYAGGCPERPWTREMEELVAVDAHQEERV